VQCPVLLIVLRIPLLHWAPDTSSVRGHMLRLSRRQ
jgi:hypothetical protein